MNGETAMNNDTTLPDTLPDTVIQGALECGDARPATRWLLSLVEYRDTWWNRNGQAWDRVISQALLAELTALRADQDIQVAAEHRTNTHRGTRSDQ